MPEEAAPAGRAGDAVPAGCDPVVVPVGADSGSNGAGADWCGTWNAPAGSGSPRYRRAARTLGWSSPSAAGPSLANCP